MPLPMRQELNPLGTMDVVQVKAAPDTGINPVDQTQSKERALNAQAVGSVLGNWARQFNKEGSEAAFLDGVRQEALIGANAEANKELNEPNLWKDAFGKGVQKTAAALMPQRTDERVASMAQAALTSNTDPKVFAQQAQQHIETELARFKDMPEVDPNILIHVASRGMASLEQGIKGYSTAFSKKQEVMQTAERLKQQTASINYLSTLLINPVAFGQQFGEDYVKQQEDISFIPQDKVDNQTAAWLSQVANTVYNAPGTSSNRLLATQQYLGLVQQLSPEMQNKVDPAVKRLMSSVADWNAYSLESTVASADAALGAGNNPIPLLHQAPLFAQYKKDINSIQDAQHVLKGAVQRGEVTPSAATTVSKALSRLEENWLKPPADKPLVFFPLETVRSSEIPRSGKLQNAAVSVQAVQVALATPDGQSQLYKAIQGVTQSGNIFGQGNTLASEVNFGMVGVLQVIEAADPTLTTHPGWSQIVSKVVEFEVQRVQATVKNPVALRANGGQLMWLHSAAQNEAVKESIPRSEINNKLLNTLNAVAGDPKIQTMPIRTAQDIAAKEQAFATAFAERWQTDPRTLELSRTVTSESIDKAATAYIGETSWYVPWRSGTKEERTANAKVAAVFLKDDEARQRAAGIQSTMSDIEEMASRLPVRSPMGPAIFLPPSMVRALGVSGSESEVVDSFHSFLKARRSLDDDQITALKGGKLIQRENGRLVVLDTRVVTDAATQQYVIQTKPTGSVTWSPVVIGSMQDFQTYHAERMQKKAIAETTDVYTKLTLTGKPVTLNLAETTPHAKALAYLPTNVGLPIQADPASQVNLLTQYTASVGGVVTPELQLLGQSLKKTALPDRAWAAYQDRVIGIGIMLQHKGVNPNDAGKLLSGLVKEASMSMSAKDFADRGILRGAAKNAVLQAFAKSHSVGERDALRIWYRQQVEALNHIILNHQTNLRFK